MGCVLVRKFLAIGISVRVLTLKDDPNISRLEGTGVEIRFGDISQPEDLLHICEDIDQVFHLAAVIISDDESDFERINACGTRTILAEAKKSGVKHFVYISSASVLYPQPTAYSLSKRAAEHLVRESGVPWTIVRPTLVYGKVGGLEFDMFLKYLRSFPVVPFIGSGEAIKRPVYVDDLVQGICSLESFPDGTGKAYNFSGGKGITMLDFTRLCLILMGKEHKPILHLPVWVCKLLAWILQRTMKKPPLRWNMIAGVIQDADLDPSEATRDLGYRPVSVAEKLPECFPRV